jgi:redox-regulated HSP33 family molecular chaperone
MAIGLLEAFELINRYASKKIDGVSILTVEEILFASDCYRRKGCRMIRTTLTAEDIKQVIELGKRIKGKIGELA